MRNNTGTSVQSISRAVSILNVLSQKLRRVSDISREVKLSYSTVHRILKSLEESGFVAEDTTTHRYYLGPSLIKIASDPISSHQHLIHCSYEKMKVLREVTEETISIHVKHGARRICVQELTSTHDVSYVIKPTIDSLLWAGAMGRVLLAQIPEDELNVIMDNIQFVQLTPKTVNDKNLLWKQVEEVKQAGYVVSHSEAVQGIAVISVPVTEYIEPVALSIIGPEDRLTSHLQDFISLLKSKAEDITKDLSKVNRKSVVVK